MQRPATDGCTHYLSVAPRPLEAGDPAGEVGAAYRQGLLWKVFATTDVFVAR